MGNKISKENNNCIIKNNHKNDQIFKKIEIDKNNNFILEYNNKEDYRLLDQHFMTKIILNTLCKTPIIKLIEEKNEYEFEVLDAGCGNCAWSLSMAKEFPKIKIYGIDIIDNFPKDIKPINCSFIKENLFIYTEKYNSKKFDYIFQRYMSMYLKEEQWKILIKNYYNMLKPGGFIEIVESNIISSNMGPDTQDFANQLVFALQARKINPYINTKIESFLVSAGFIIKEKNYVSTKLFNDEIINDIYGTNVLQSLENMKNWITKTFDIKDDDFFKILEKIKKESKKYNTFNNTYYYVAYKSRNKK